MNTNGHRLGSLLALVLLAATAACTASSGDASTGEDDYKVKPKGDEGTRIAYFQVTWPQGELPDNDYFPCALGISWKRMRVSIAAGDAGVHTLTDESQTYQERAPASANLSCVHRDVGGGLRHLIEERADATGTGTKADPFTVRLGRLDVDHVDVVDTTTGDHRTARGEWIVLNSNGLNHVSVYNRAATGTGVYVLPGKYTVTTSFMSINGSEEDVQEALVE